MDADQLFSGGYQQARDRFLVAARERGAALETATLPDRVGASGEPLRTDVAVLGGPGAPRALVLISGTHGAEGFAGSALQLAVLRGAVELPAETDLVAVHALNPFGFSHRRRVNEDNVDVNRNFVDHSSPPASPLYARVHDALLPTDWEGPGHRRAQEDLLALAAELGVRGVQAAITSGQYSHPDGLFYGGSTPTWSNQVWRSVVAEQLSGYTEICCIDLHTGLGARGGVEAIFRGGVDPGALGRARRWFGDLLTRSEDGTSSSTSIGGNTTRGLLEGLPPQTVLTAVTGEFGTQQPLLVLRALQADNWLWQRGRDTGPQQRAAIAELMTEAFDPPDPAWRSAVLKVGTRLITKALRGLADID
jgi:hypothetical protein